MIRLNLGCGTDYREGFINIDGSDILGKADKIIDLDRDSLIEHFEVNSVDFILANDIIEHFFHWQAIRILKDCHDILKPGGLCEIRVPDCSYIINSWRLPLETKLRLLFGGQDIPQDDNEIINESRKRYPNFFCHKYGWTRKSLARELISIGFSHVLTKRFSTNFTAYAQKSD